VKQPLQSLITAATPKSPQVRCSWRGSMLEWLMPWVSGSRTCCLQLSIRVLPASCTGFGERQRGSAAAVCAHNFSTRRAAAALLAAQGCCGLWSSSRPASGARAGWKSPNVGICLALVAWMPVDEYTRPDTNMRVRMTRKPCVLFLQAQQRADAATSEAAAAKETAGHELALMRRQLAHAQSALVSAEKVRTLARPCRSLLHGHLAVLAARPTCSWLAHTILAVDPQERHRVTHSRWYLEVPAMYPQQKMHIHTGGGGGHSGGGGGTGGAGGGAGARLQAGGAGGGAAAGAVPLRRPGARAGGVRQRFQGLGFPPLR
jgi:hypothetical protein